jgi:hypothetical protein
MIKTAAGNCSIGFNSSGKIAYIDWDFKIHLLWICRFLCKDCTVCKLNLHQVMIFKWHQ